MSNNTHKVVFVDCGLDHNCNDSHGNLLLYSKEDAEQLAKHVNTANGYQRGTTFYYAAREVIQCS